MLAMNVLSQSHNESAKIIKNAKRKEIVILLVDVEVAQNYTA